MENYKLIILDGRLSIKGKDIEFNLETFFDLVPGQVISQIGNGKENGTIRTDKFVNPVEYIGTIMVQFQKLEKMYAFKLPESVDGDNLYFLYGSTGHEIFTEAVYSFNFNRTGKPFGYLRFYAPEFKILESAKK